MDRRHVLALSGALMAGTLAGCAEALPSTDDPDTQAAPGPEPAIDDEALRELVHQTNGFTFDLYRTLLEDRPNKNFIGSPVSVSLALAMTHAGARGDTRSQMREVLRYTREDETLNAAFDTLQQELNRRGGDVNPAATAGDRYGEDDDPVPFELSLVNALWGQEDFPFKDRYLDVLIAHFGAGFRDVDYTSDPEAVRQRINDWVAGETNERIEALLPEGALDTRTKLVLVNAIYFLANWKHPFHSGSTQPESFVALDGSEHEVSMMQEDRSWQYAEIDGTQAVELPYVGDEVSMLVILPPAGSFESYERSFDGETLAELVGALESREGSVQLPRFAYETSVTMKETLRAMGMSDAFDAEEADFGDMAHLDRANGTLSIDQVYHDAYIGVDEEGTEAAAATGVVIEAVSAPMDPFEFTADRPFLFVIRDRPTETVLFLGRVVDPTGWE